MDILIKRIRIVDPSQCLDTIADIGIENGIITRLGKVSQEADRVIDGTGLMAMPGIVDMHTHLREPGQTQKEDIESACRAAANGGVTTLGAMPNTTPCADSCNVIASVINRAKEVGLARVIPIGAMTAGMRGDTPCDYDMMKKLGVTAVSEDGKTVVNSQVMREIIESAKKAGLLPISHCEDIALVNGGVMNEGKTAEKLGLKGNPAIAEEIIIARDIMIAEYTNSPIHIAHVSSKGGVEIIRAAKRRGAKVTCETAPHYFTLTEEAVKRLGADAKMNPPLRTAADREAIIDGLRDGTIDVIATDHAPHTEQDKSGNMEKAANGIVGLETSFALSYTELVKSKIIPLPQLVKLMSLAPAKLLNLPIGSLHKGCPADIAIINLDEKWTVDKNEFYSKGRNTPFDKRELFGRAVYTIFSGKIVMENRKIIREEK